MSKEPTRKHLEDEYARLIQESGRLKKVAKEIKTAIGMLVKVEACLERSQKIKSE